MVIQSGAKKQSIIHGILRWVPRQARCQIDTLAPIMLAAYSMLI
jgi:hypothetical protein